MATRYSARISGVDSIAIALLDVLSGFEELYICEAYEVYGKRTQDLPSQCSDLAAAKPILRKIDGWQEDISGVTQFEDLPPAAQRYLQAVSEIVGRPVELVSVGPDRAQTILLNKPA